MTKNNLFRNRSGLLLLCLVAAISIALWEIGTIAIRTARAADISEIERISPFDTRSLWLLRQARAIIETYQVDAETRHVTEEQLVHGAIMGMVQAWEDPYTRFVTPSQLREERIQMEGQYGGVGMYIGDRNGRVLVISPIEDTPADRAGLRPMDQIVRIGDEMALGWDSREVVRRLRGQPNTPVTLWIRREDEEELLKFDLVREMITIRSVRHEMLYDDIGYLRLTNFMQTTEADAEQAVRDMMNQGARGLILDLRNNGGGLLNVCINIASMFLEGGLVVETRGRVGKANEEYNANPARFLTDMPMVVLINEGSASASEIVAGALSDRNRATTVGQKSFGKGSVQTLFNLTDGSGVYVTIARYFTPSGRAIDQVGLIPHIEVEGRFERDRVQDAQLQRAISELRRKMSTATASM